MLWLLVATLIGAACAVVAIVHSTDSIHGEGPPHPSPDTNTRLLRKILAHLDPEDPEGQP